MANQVYDQDRTDNIKNAKGDPPSDSVNEQALNEARLAGEAVEVAEEEEAVEPHIFTIAELRAFAAEYEVEIDPEAKRKADIEDSLLDGLTVAGLREYARRTGENLHGATTRDEIIAAFGGEEEPKSAFVMDSFPTLGGSESEEEEDVEEDPRDFTDAEVKEIEKGAGF